MALAAATHHAAPRERGGVGQTGSTLCLARKMLRLGRCSAAGSTLPIPTLLKAFPLAKLLMNKAMCVFFRVTRKR